MWVDVVTHWLAMLRNGRSIMGLGSFDLSTKGTGSLANAIVQALFTLDVVNDTALL